MTVDQEIGKFALDVHQEGLKDLFDIDDCMDEIVHGLMEEATDVPDTVWMALSLLRQRLDDVRFRSLVGNGYIHKAMSIQNDIQSKSKINET